MKRIVVLALFLISGSSVALAQDFKPVAGNWGAEVNFTPFSSSPVSLNYLRFRNFTSDNSAFRLGVFLGYEQQNPDEDVKNTTFEINIRPGIEKHFEGTDRLSPYVGGELDVAYKSSKSTIDDGGTVRSIEGAWSDFGQERGFFRFGLNAIAGVDYYITKGLYLGTEFGFGFEYILQSDIEEFRGNLTVDKIEGGSTFQLGPNVNGAIRLGFNF